MTMALNDHYSVVAATLAAVPSAMPATIVFAISELSARAAKRTVPIHIAVAANPNAELLRTRYGRSGDRNRSERSKSIS
jgi:hypothetical protein